jgi:hypothetical protein
MAKAAHSFAEAVQQDPSLLTAQLNEGIALLHSQDLARAKPLLQDVVERDPYAPSIWTGDFYPAKLFRKCWHITKASSIRCSGLTLRRRFWKMRRRDGRRDRYCAMRTPRIQGVSTQSRADWSALWDGCQQIFSRGNCQYYFWSGEHRHGPRTG